MDPARAKARIRGVRVAFRDVDPLSLSSAESDEYDQVSFRAASALLSGESVSDAISGVEAAFRDDWGSRMTWRKRRLLTARLTHVVADWQ